MVFRAEEEAIEKELVEAMIVLHSNIHSGELQGAINSLRDSMSPGGCTLHYI